MAQMPDYLKFTPEEQAALDKIKEDAKVRHEKARQAAAKRGRRDFPDLPYEYSWAYEQEFFRNHSTCRARMIDRRAGRD